MQLTTEPLTINFHNTNHVHFHYFYQLKNYKMKKILILFFVLFLVPGAVLSQIQSIDEELFNLRDVSFKKIESLDNDAIAYELKIRQLIDHNNPDVGYFYQRAFLNHKSVEKPVVFVTEGYTCSANWPTELSRLLKANQLAVEHRYFGESIPDSVGYEYLNLEQATADLHHINKIFREIYPDNWISTGISKGGATTIFYKYFYPEDVNVSVPYVAPINREFEEQRIYDFFDTISTKKCRKKIKDFQIRVLENRDKILPLIKFYSLGANLSFSYLTMEEAFELAVLEYPFSLFQWGHDCNMIPGKNASVEDLAQYLLYVSGVDFFSDESMEAFASHYYQSAQEMGYYGYETEEFRDYLVALDPDKNPHAAFVPNKEKVEFDGSLLDKVNSWLPENGNRMIYIYGAVDTWSASAVPPSDKVDALWFFIPGAHHGSARIRNMNETDKLKLVESMEKWLDIEIALSQ